MKLATYQNSSGAQRIAAINVEEQIALDLAEAAVLSGLGECPEFASMLTLIRSGASGLEKAQAIEKMAPRAASLSLTEIKLLSPLPEPSSLRDCLVFEEHLLNTRTQFAKMAGSEPGPISPLWYTQPSYYKGNRYSIIGPDTDVIWPSYAEQMDYELELACIIGKEGINIPRERALDHIFGFTIFNDFSARDVQLRERSLGMGPTKAKDFQTGNVLGPWITTLDEIGDPHNLAMSARVNGELQGGGNSSTMHHKFEDIVSFISRDEMLRSGDVIATGTVGTGCGLELGRFLQPNDIVELQVEKIGVLRNRIVRK